MVNAPMKENEESRRPQADTTKWGGTTGHQG